MVQKQNTKISIIMNVKHHPITKISQVIEVYSEKDGVDINYVCTSELPNGKIGDIFYRSTPHPKFGNKYFAIFFHGDDAMISNADFVENFTFGVVENDIAEYEYSQSRHDYKSFKNGNMIDGGRNYVRSSGTLTVMIVRNGQLTYTAFKNNDG